jgi:hypothetical protein
MWIESHQALGRHPKLIRLAVRLQVHRAQAVGHLHYLWWWALDFAPNGNLSAFTPTEIAYGAEWPGEPDKFHDALQDGWLDPDGSLHDWHEYAGKLLERRNIDRERKRVHRTSNGSPSDGVRTNHTNQPYQPNPPTQERAAVEQKPISSNAQAGLGSKTSIDSPQGRETRQRSTGGDCGPLDGDELNQKVAAWIGQNQISARVMPSPVVFRDFRALVDAVGWDEACRLVLDCAKDRKVVRPVAAALARASREQGMALAERSNRKELQADSGEYE